MTKKPIVKEEHINYNYIIDRYLETHSKKFDEMRNKGEKIK